MTVGETNQSRFAADLIKRDDALAAIDTFKRDFEQSWKAQFSADIKALPAVTTHRYAGGSEASVYDRKGFPPIGLQGHAHAPVADRQPAVDPAAIREAALQARIEELLELNQELTLQLLAVHGQAADALDKLTKAVEALKWYARQAADCRKITKDGDIARHKLDRDGGSKARAVFLALLNEDAEGMAELEGK